MSKIPIRYLTLLGLLLVSLLTVDGEAAIFSGYAGNRTDGTGALIDTAGGISATGNSWAVTGNNRNFKGVRLDWTVDQSGNNWVYVYTFSMASGALKDILNFDLQVAADFTAGALLSQTVIAPAAGVTGPAAGVTPPAAISENSGAIASPSILGITQGYQWNCAGTSDYSFTTTITTARAPVWGDFIVRSSETTATDFLTAYNSGFGTVKGAFPLMGGIYNGQVAVPGPGPADSSHSLTVTFTGNGGGNVNSTPSGIACSGPPCSGTFPDSQQVTLLGSADSTSVFAGWSGDCSGLECAVTMDAARSVSAQFTAAPPVMGGTVPYLTLQNAFDQASDTIRALAISYPGNLLFNRTGTALQFQGGFDGSYEVIFGRSVINGGLTISNGTLKVSNVIVRSPAP